MKSLSIYKSMVLVFSLLLLSSCSSEQKRKEQHLFGASVGRWHAEPLRYDPHKGQLYAIGMSEGGLISSEPEDVAKNRAFERVEGLWRSSLTGLKEILRSRSANPYLEKHRMEEILAPQRVLKTGDEVFLGKDSLKRTWVVYRFELRDRWLTIQDELMENLAGIRREELEGVKVTGDKPLMNFLFDIRKEMANAEAAWGRYPNHKGLGISED